MKTRLLHVLFLLFVAAVAADLTEWNNATTHIRGAKSISIHARRGWKCVQEGGPCQSYSDCCFYGSLVCDAGFCLPRDPASSICHTKGERCISYQDCCFDLDCTGSKCVDGAGTFTCGEENDQCDSTRPCCRGLSCTRSGCVLDDDPGCGTRNDRCDRNRPCCSGFRCTTSGCVDDEPNCGLRDDYCDSTHQCCHGLHCSRSGCVDDNEPECGMRNDYCDDSTRNRCCPGLVCSRFGCVDDWPANTCLKEGETCPVHGRHGDSCCRGLRCSWRSETCVQDYGNHTTSCGMTNDYCNSHHEPCCPDFTCIGSRCVYDGPGPLCLKEGENCPAYGGDCCQGLRCSWRRNICVQDHNHTICGKTGDYCDSYSEPCCTGFTCMGYTCVSDYRPDSCGWSGDYCGYGRPCCTNFECRQSRCQWRQPGPDPGVRQQCMSIRDCQRGFRCIRNLCTRADPEDPGAKQFCINTRDCPIDFRCIQNQCERYDYYNNYYDDDECSRIGELCSANRLCCGRNAMCRDGWCILGTGGGIYNNDPPVVSDCEPRGAGCLRTADCCDPMHCRSNICVGL